MLPPLPGAAVDGVRLTASETVALGPEGCLGSIGDPRCGEGRRRSPCGALADVEPPGDLLVRQSLTDRGEHLTLAGRQLHLL